MKKHLITILIIVGLFIIIFSSILINPDPIKMVAIGDSITYGTGDPQKKGYIGRFKEQFEEKTDSKIQMSNFGVPRYSTEDVLTQIKIGKVKREIKQADYILLYIGTNDFRKSAKYHFSSINQKKVDAGRKKFSENLHLIFEKIRTENSVAPILVIGLYHPYTEYKNQEQILRLINKWNTEITEVAFLYGPTKFVETLDLFSGKAKKSYFSDSIHLNAAGYELIANRVFKEMLILDS